jgi:hypothetical protein
MPISQFASSSPSIEHKTNRRLADYPLDTANFVRPLISDVDMTKYERFLNTMYVYTRHSGPNLAFAATLSKYRPVIEYFEHMAKDEAKHYRLADLDLKGLGLQRDPDFTSPAVNEFWRWWNSVTKEESITHVGAIFVLENWGLHCLEDVPIALSRLGLGKRQSRFVRVHMTADVEHGALAGQLVDKYWDSHREDLVYGAERAAHLTRTMWEEFTA